MNRARSPGLVILLLALAGCGQGPAPAPGTGAKEVVEQFCDALCRREWKQAHDCLHPADRKRYPLPQFSRVADSFRKKLGFDPERVVVRSCEEQETRAVAHVTFSGNSTLGRQQYRDGMTLVRAEGSWRILLLQHFGR